MASSSMGDREHRPGRGALHQTARARRRARGRPRARNTPARQAATYSPRLCPSIASGDSPQASKVEARAYSTAKSAGWATAVLSRRRHALELAQQNRGRRAREGRPRSAPWSPRLERLLAQEGASPCPRTALLAPGTGARRPSPEEATTPRPPSASSRRAASSALEATTALRKRAGRFGPVPRVSLTAASGGSSSRRWPARSRQARPTAKLVAAETTRRCEEHDDDRAGRAGAAPRITWAFGPADPERAHRGMGAAAAPSRRRARGFTRNGLSARPVSGFSRSKWSVGGIARW